MDKAEWTDAFERALADKAHWPLDCRFCHLEQGLPRHWRY